MSDAHQQWLRRHDACAVPKNRAKRRYNGDYAAGVEPLSRSVGRKAVRLRSLDMACEKAYLVSFRRASTTCGSPSFVQHVWPFL